MKKALFFVLMLWIVTACTSPTLLEQTNETKQTIPISSKAQLIQRLDTYFDASKRLATNEILDMIYYKVFEVVPRDSMQKQLDAGLKNMMQPKVKAIDYNKNIEIKKYVNGEYAKVLWSSKMEMFTKTTDSKKEEFMLKMLQLMMQRTEIKLDAKVHKFLLETKEQGIFAIKENGRAWEFVDDRFSKSYNILPQGVK